MLLTNEEELAYAALLFQFPNQHADILAGMQPEYMISEELADVVNLAITYRDQKIKFNSNFVKAKLGKDEENEEFLLELDDLIAGSGAEIENLRHYKTKIVDTYIFGQMKTLLNGRLTKMKRNRDEIVDIRSFCYAVAEEVRKVAENGTFDKIGLRDDYNEFLEKVKRAAERTDSDVDVLFDCPDLDQFFEPSEEGRLILIGAPSSHGKSSIGTNIMGACMKKGEDFYYRSGEMTTFDTFSRLVQFLFHISTKFITTGSMVETEGYVERLEKKLEGYLDRAGTMISDGPLSLDNIVSTCWYYTMKYGTRKYIFDRAELFKDISAAKAQDKLATAETIASTLRSLCKELKIDIFVMAQHKLEAANNVMANPMYSILGGTVWPANAHVVINMFNAYKAGKHNLRKDSGYTGVSSRVTDEQTGNHIELVDVHVVKNTRGSTGRCVLGFWGPGQIFFNYEFPDKDQKYVGKTEYDPVYDEKRFETGNLAYSTGSSGIVQNEDDISDTNGDAPFSDNDQDDEDTPW